MDRCPTQESHQKRRLPRTRWTDNEVDFIRSKDKLIFNPEYELALRGCQGAVDVAGPGERRRIETDLIFEFRWCIREGDLPIFVESISIQKFGLFIHRSGQYEQQS